MERRIEQYGVNTQIEREVLSDESIAFNVIYQVDGKDDSGAPRLRFACESERRARDLASALEICSWVEVL